eukprot:scaffold1630_cov298-Prasinococcus_capsulatus_cf.AAC.4
MSPPRPRPPPPPPWRLLVGMGPLVVCVGPLGAGPVALLLRTTGRPRRSGYGGPPSRVLESARDVCCTVQEQRGVQKARARARAPRRGVGSLTSATRHPQQRRRLPTAAAPAAAAAATTTTTMTMTMTTGSAESLPFLVPPGSRAGKGLAGQDGLALARRGRRQMPRCQGHPSRGKFSMTMAHSGSGHLGCDRARPGR